MARSRYDILHVQTSLRELDNGDLVLSINNPNDMIVKKCVNLHLHSTCANSNLISFRLVKGNRGNYLKLVASSPDRILQNMLSLLYAEAISKNVSDYCQSHEEESYVVNIFDDSPYGGASPCDAV